MHSQISSHNSPCFICREIRTPDFTMSKVDHWALESLRPDGQSTLNFLRRNFPYRDFATCDIKHCDFPTSDTRCDQTLTHTCELIFPPPVTSYQDFRIRRITNPDVNGFGTCLFPIPDMVCHLSSTNIAMAHTIL
jgi:hypothetical protein